MTMSCLSSASLPFTNCRTKTSERRFSASFVFYWVETAVCRSWSLIHPFWLAFSFEQTTIGDIPSVHFRKTFYDVRSDVRHLSSYAARVRGPSSGCRLAFVFVCVCLVGACVWTCGAGAFRVVFFEVRICVCLCAHFRVLNFRLKYRKQTRSHRVLDDTLFYFLLVSSARFVPEVPFMKLQRSWLG